MKSQYSNYRKPEVLCKKIKYYQTADNWEYHNFANFTDMKWYLNFDKFAIFDEIVSHKMGTYICKDIYTGGL